MKGLYIHIPFCLSKCPYCDFYSSVQRKDINQYCDALINEMETGNRTFEFTHNADLSFDTIYFGGGTPSVLGAENIAKLVNAAMDNYNISVPEITVECNPSCVDENFFKIIASAGVNRISLGLQSAVDNERKSLGRKATAEQTLEAINLAFAAGIDNISLDVMLGIPHQTMSSLDETIDFCLSSNVPHISAYMLSIEENTVFYRKKDSLPLPDEDTVCDMYLHLCDRLRCNNTERYEISNFAKKGFESRHNLKYWNCEEYLGLGPSAHSFIDGKRFYFRRNTSEFIYGNTAVFDDFGGDMAEFVMLKLRLADGLNNQDYYNRFGSLIPSKMFKRAEDFAEGGYVTISKEAISLTDRGALISNHIIGNLVNCLT